MIGTVGRPETGAKEKRPPGRRQGFSRGLGGELSDADAAAGSG